MPSNINQLIANLMRSPVYLSDPDVGTGVAGIAIFPDPTGGGIVAYNTTDTYDPEDGSGTYRLLIDLQGNVSLNDAALTITGTGYIALGNPPPTSATVGTGIWIDETGIFGLASNVQQAYMSATTGKILAGAGAVTLDVDGITISAGAGDPNAITWKSGSNEVSELFGQVVGGTTAQLNIFANYKDATPAYNHGIIALTAYDLSANTATLSVVNQDGFSGYVASDVALMIGASTSPSSLLHLKSTAPTFRMEDSTASAKSLLVTVDANLATFGEVTGGTFFTLDLANKDVKLDGDLLFTDATYDIGASGATRPRHLYLSGNAVIGGTITGTTTGNAPVGSAFVTIGTDATLTGERALTGTSNQITVTDNGAGSTVVLSTPQDIDTTASPQFANVKITASGHLFPSSDSTSAIRIANAAGTDFASFDTTNGRFGLGILVPTKLFELNGTTQPLIRMVYTSASSSSVGPAIDFYTNDGAAVASGDRIGAFQFGGATDASNTLYTSVFALAKTTEAFSGTAGGGKLEIYTTPNTTHTPTLALTLDQDQGLKPAGDVTIANAKNIILNTSTGTKIGTGTTQKLGFWNATPIVQPSAYTQTYSTANKTLNADGVTDPAAYGAGANGYSTGAMASAVHAAVIALHADLLDLKQFVNSLVDDLQSMGLIS